MSRAYKNRKKNEDRDKSISSINYSPSLLGKLQEKNRKQSRQMMRLRARREGRYNKKTDTIIPAEQPEKKGTDETV